MILHVGQLALSCLEGSTSTSALYREIFHSYYLIILALHILQEYEEFLSCFPIYRHIYIYISYLYIILSIIVIYILYYIYSIYYMHNSYFVS